MNIDRSETCNFLKLTERYLVRFLVREIVQYRDRIGTGIFSGNRFDFVVKRME